MAAPSKIDSLIRFDLYETKHHAKSIEEAGPDRENIWGVIMQKSQITGSGIKKDIYCYDDGLFPGSRYFIDSIRRNEGGTKVQFRDNERRYDKPERCLNAAGN